MPARVLTAPGVQKKGEGDGVTLSPDVGDGEADGVSDGEADGDSDGEADGNGKANGDGSNTCEKKRDAGVRL